MTASQRLLLGIGVGAVLALIASPASRSLLLHPIRTNAVIESLESSPIADSKTLLPEPQPNAYRDPALRELTASQIATLLIANPAQPLAEREYKIAEKFFQLSWDNDRDNAIWPQMLATIKARNGNFDAAFEDWKKASALTTWACGTQSQVKDLWESLSTIENRKLAWQGLLALRNRPTSIAQLICRTAGILSKHFGIEGRYYSLANLDLLREGTRSLYGARRASEESLRTSGLNIENQTQALPVSRERRYIEFQTQVRNTLGQEASTSALVLMRRNDSWIALLKSDEEIAAQSRTLSSQAVLCASMPSAFLWAGIIFAFLAGAMYLVASHTRTIPHPSRGGVFLVFVLAAALFWFAGSPWLVAVWFLFLGVLLSWPIEVADPNPTEWNGLNNAAQAIIALFSLITLMLWVIAISPSKLLLENVAAVVDRLASRPQTWLELAAGVFSLAIPCAVVWARVKRKPTVSIACETMSRIGFIAAILGLIGTIVSTPVCMYWDKTLQTGVNERFQNESVVYRINQP